MKSEDLENLQYELNITLEAMLLYAGVKRTKLDEAVQEYIECIDEVLENFEGEGVDEVLAVVAYLKKHKSELFA